MSKQHYTETMIIGMVSQKGGPGKTTVTVNLAAELARRGADVMLVDADHGIASASNWVADRAENPALPVVHSIQKQGNVRAALIDLDKRYDYVLVDVAGRDSQEMRTAMTAAHLLVVPMRPSQLDLDTIPRLLELIEAGRDLNPGLLVAGLLSQVPTNASATEDAEARGFLADYPQIPLLQTMIRERKVYRDCMGEGKGVIEMKNAKAKAEVQVLVEELLSWR